MLAIDKILQDIPTKIEKLPDKWNFKIGEVSDFLKVPAYVLRYWEKEFSSLKPEKFINNQRLYTKKDIQKLVLIKKLLYEEKFSIEGLRKHLPFYLKAMKSKKVSAQAPPATARAIKVQLQGLLNSIKDIKDLIHS